MKKICCCLVFIYSAMLGQNRTQTFAWDDEKFTREQFVNFEKMQLQVSFVPEKGLVKGQVTHHFKNIRPQTDSVCLDAVNITVQQVFYNGSKAKFRSTDSGLTIYSGRKTVLNSMDSIRIIYECTPVKGIYFIGWNDTTNRCRKQIWTQGQGTDNRHWIPMWDDLNDKMKIETTVIFPGQYKVLSNGKKVTEKLNQDGTKTWKYVLSQPMSTYLLMLGIGDYEVKEEKSLSGKPIQYYIYPEWVNRMQYTYRYTKQIMDFLEKETGVPFPWESYAQIPVQDFMYGAMENTTATVFGDFFCSDSRGIHDRDYVPVNAHEMAHQWFGDMVTARCEPHHWLQESFATHYNWLAEKEIFGDDHFNWGRRNAQHQILEASLKDNYPIVHSKAGSTRYYPKGASVLYMLKLITGRDLFNKSIAHYLNKHAYKNVDTHDLLVAFEEVTGMSLGWFWEQWLYKGGEPEYEVSFHPSLPGHAETGHIFEIKQVQVLNDYNSIFRMPMVFQVHYKDGSVASETHWVSGTYHKVTIQPKAGAEIDFVLFDPGNQVLKKVTFPKPDYYLLSQAEKATDMLDRFDAFVALRDNHSPAKRKLLEISLFKETFHGIRSEILKQLLEYEEVEKDKIVAEVVNGKDVQLKKTLIAIKGIPTESMFALYEKMLTDSSYDLIAGTLHLLCSLNPSQAARYCSLTESLPGNKGATVLIKRLEIKADMFGDSAALRQLSDMSGISFEFQTRVNALQALKRLGYFNRQIFRNALQAMCTANSRLSGPAAEVASYFFAMTRYKSFMMDIIEGEGRSPRENAIIKSQLKY